jgi:UrcA family protein
MSIKYSLGRQVSLSIVAAVTGAVLASAAGVAVADTTAAEAAPALAVKYKNSELATREGSLALYKRITSAASEVCAVTNHQDIGGFTKYQACKRAAIERAVNELHSPQLAAVHSDHSHKG